jgi:hypothetical protein
MALFTNPPESKMTEAHAYLDPGSSVSGKLEFEGPALIYGHIEGEIDATDVVMIGEGAVLTAQVKAASVLIAGIIKGAARGRRSRFRRDLPRARRSQGRGFWGATVAEILKKDVRSQSVNSPHEDTRTTKHSRLPKVLTRR